MRDSATHTLGFAAAVCVVCAVLVSTTSVALRDEQAANRALDRQKKVLAVARLMPERGRLSAHEVDILFEQQVRTVDIDLREGAPRDEPLAGAPDTHVSLPDPSQSYPAPHNQAGILRLPKQARLYLVDNGQGPDSVVLPVEGKGLWSTLYGYLALDRDDLRTIVGIEFFEHGETPGLGGEIDNPRWKASWRGRLAFDASGEPAIHVARGNVGPPGQDPYRVDALTGATLTARGVTNLVQFWLSDRGYGPYLDRLRREGELR